MEKKAVGAAIGALVGAAGLGAAAAFRGDLPGFAEALALIPPYIPEDGILITLKASLAGGAAGALLGGVLAARRRGSAVRATPA